MGEGGDGGWGLGPEVGGEARGGLRMGRVTGGDVGCVWGGYAWHWRGWGRLWRWGGEAHRGVGALRWQQWHGSSCVIWPTKGKRVASEILAAFTPHMWGCRGRCRVPFNP